MMIAILLINVVVLIAIIVLFKEFLALYKASVMEKSKIYNTIELIMDQKQLALYNAIEAKMAATKSHVLDTKRAMHDLPAIIKTEIKGELGQIRLAQADLLDLIELLRKKADSKAQQKSHTA